MYSFSIQANIFEKKNKVVLQCTSAYRNIMQLYNETIKQHRTSEEKLHFIIQNSSQTFCSWYFMQLNPICTPLVPSVVLELCRAIVRQLWHLLEPKKFPAHSSLLNKEWFLGLLKRSLSLRRFLLYQLV